MGFRSRLLLNQRPINQNEAQTCRIYKGNFSWHELFNASVTNNEVKAVTSVEK